jgi:hypothetical protein
MPSKICLEKTFLQTDFFSSRGVGIVLLSGAYTPLPLHHGLIGNLSEKTSTKMS